ncbi:cytochrome P450 [Polymorphospora lycopeni]|uniref:Cytochrome P450 n=1 Tax=Polymorphospora lycopeni TaxID=3140240 RepID=A0ABV5CRV1_9ACTN
MNEPRTPARYSEIFRLDGVADPFPAYADLRQRAPVHRLVQPDGVETWFVCRYEEARAALTDPRLAHHLSHARTALESAGIELTEERIEFGAAHLLHSDPPDHTRLRGVVKRAFTPAAIERLRPRVQQITDDLLDGIADRAGADLVETLAHPLPVLVICELLGVPVADRDRFRVWAEAALTPSYVENRPMTRAAGDAALREYLTELVERTRHDATVDDAAFDDRPDLLRTLITARDEQGLLAEREVVAMLYLLLVAGFESTTNFLGNTILRLLLERVSLDRLRDDPALLHAAVEESLRLDGPVQRSTLRTAVQDLTIGGVAVPEGSVVSIGLASANRDRTRFADADAFHPDRSDQAHLAFGHGRHFCLGAPLARLEGEIALSSLLRRYTTIRLAVRPEELRWRHTFLRGLTTLPVVFTAD